MTSIRFACPLTKTAPAAYWTEIHVISQVGKQKNPLCKISNVPVWEMLNHSLYILIYYHLKCHVAAVLYSSVFLHVCYASPIKTVCPKRTFSDSIHLSLPMWQPHSSAYHRICMRHWTYNFLTVKSNVLYSIFFNLKEGILFLLLHIYESAYRSFVQRNLWLVMRCWNCTKSFPFGAWCTNLMLCLSCRYFFYWNWIYFDSVFTEMRLETCHMTTLTMNFLTILSCFAPSGICVPNYWQFSSVGPWTWAVTDNIFRALK